MQRRAARASTGSRQRPAHRDLAARTGDRRGRVRKPLPQPGRSTGFPRARNV